MTTVNTASVMNGLAIAATTRSTAARAACGRETTWRGATASPVFVPSAKKSHRNKPDDQLQLVGGSGNRNENTLISTMKSAAGFSSAHTKPLSVPWKRVLKSVRTSVHARPSAFGLIMGGSTTGPVAAPKEPGSIVRSSCSTFSASGTWPVSSRHPSSFLYVKALQAPPSR